MRVALVSAAGSVVSAILASACCIGPLVFALLGVSGGAIAQRFEPLRPYLLALTFALLAGAFYVTYRPRASCGGDGVCERPRVNRLSKVMLWLAAGIVFLAAAFPWYAHYLPL